MNTNSHNSKPATVSRRGFLGRAAVTGGAVLLGSGLPARVWADQSPGGCGAPGLCDFPVPIPHFTSPPGQHFFFPGPVEGVDANHGHDPSVIFNFQGFIGQADLTLSGTGTDLHSGATGVYQFHTDMRFMDGVFIGTDGMERQGAFAFI